MSTISVQGEWKGETAGGCLNHCTWRHCPQFFLHIFQNISKNAKVGQFSICDLLSEAFFSLSSHWNKALDLDALTLELDFILSTAKKVYPEERNLWLILLSRI